MSMLTDFTCEYMLQMIKDECWISLHFENPDLAGDAGSEVTGGGYERIRATFGDISNRTMWLEEQVAWEGLRSTKITYVGGWSKSTRGKALFYVELIPPARVQDGGKWQIPQHKLVISVA